MAVLGELRRLVCLRIHPRRRRRVAGFPIARHSMSLVEGEETLQNRRTGTRLADDEKWRVDALRENLGMVVPVSCKLQSLADEVFHLRARAGKILIGNGAGSIEPGDERVEPARQVVGYVRLCSEPCG